jgi:hypothetical protein
MSVSTDTHTYILTSMHTSIQYIQANIKFLLALTYVGKNSPIFAYIYIYICMYVTIANAPIDP